jgi:lipopolysaccharide transport system permease protein
MAKQTDHWDLVIEPTQPWWKLNIRDIWQYRDLFWLFVKREIVTTYKQTLLGPLWFFIQPALTTAMFTFVFGRIANLNPPNIPAPLFFVCGIVIWNYFAESLTSTANTFQTNASVYGKVYFPRIISPLSKVFAGLIRFGIQFLLILVLLFYFVSEGQFSPQLSWAVLWVLPLTLLMLFIGLGLGMVISSLTTKYRDLSYLLTFGIQLLMYASAVVFSINTLPQDNPFYQFVKWNPLAQVVDGFRTALLEGQSPDLMMVLYCFVFAVVSMLAGMFIFNKVEKSFIDVV